MQGTEVFHSKDPINFIHMASNILTGRMLRLAHNILTPDGYLFLTVSVQYSGIVTPALLPVLTL
jgi:hypothetical protein